MHFFRFHIEDDLGTAITPIVEIKSSEPEPPSDSSSEIRSERYEKSHAYTYIVIDSRVDLSALKREYSFSAYPK